MCLLVRRLMPVIHARARVFLARRADRRVGAKSADDLCQEVWLALLKDDGHALRAYDPERGMSLEGYVGLLTRRQLWRSIEAARSQRRGGGVTEVAVSTPPDALQPEDPEAVLVARDLAEGLRAHLDAELPARGRLVMAALYDDGLEVAEAASMLGVTRQVIYNWQHRIRTLSRSFVHAASR